MCSPMPTGGVFACSFRRTVGNANWATLAITYGWSLDDAFEISSISSMEDE